MGLPRIKKRKKAIFTKGRRIWKSHEIDFAIETTIGELTQTGFWQKAAEVCIRLKRRGRSPRNLPGNPVYCLIWKLAIDYTAGTRYTPEYRISRIGKPWGWMESYIIDRAFDPAGDGQKIHHVSHRHVAWLLNRSIEEVKEKSRRFRRKGLAQWDCPTTTNARKRTRPAATPGRAKKLITSSIAPSGRIPVKSSSTMRMRLAGS